MITRLDAALSPREKTEGKGRLLELWLEIHHYCNLRCSFCFNSAGVATFPEEQLLTLKQYMNLLDSFSLIGGKVIGIPGFGEPFHPRNLEFTLAILQQAKDLGLRAYVFTAADCIDNRLAEMLFDLDVSLMVKFNSAKPEIQDELVGVSGYTAVRAKALGILVELGFNREEHDADGAVTTRLGFVTSVLPENAAELPGIFRYCREHNIYPDIDTLLQLGRGCTQPNDEHMTADVLRNLQRLDKNHYGNDWEIVPSYAGSACDCYAHHLYLDMHGRSSPCLGANKKGIFLDDIRQSGTLARAWSSPLMQVIRNRDYSGKCTECRKFKTGACNSCLGRFAEIIGNTVTANGCWCFTE